MNRRAMVGILTTFSCDRGNGWAALHVDGTLTTYCYPLTVPRLIPRKAP